MTKLRAAPGQTFAGWTFGLLPGHIDIVLRVSLSQTRSYGTHLRFVVRASWDSISIVSILTTDSNQIVHLRLCWTQEYIWFFFVTYFQPASIILPMYFIYHIVRVNKCHHYPYQPDLAQICWKLSMLLLMFIYWVSLSLHWAIKGCEHSSKRG